LNINDLNKVPGSYSAITCERGNWKKNYSNNIMRRRKRAKGSETIMEEKKWQ
jgi:hypothetical protein